ncbi:MAG: DUF1566 domain-containing protein [Gammaproteobacteria bacterium]|nr:DUF1566 domain-containing protein [Gammaproteobacteria bacterium]
MKTYIKQLIVVFILSTLSMGGYAQTKVVVIPMVGDDILPDPFAPLTANSPAQGDYTINDNDTQGSGSTLDDTVIDNITGLEWQRTNDNTQRNWDTAFDYCVSLTLDGGGWRLPQTHELQSIVAYDEADPAINGVAFISTLSSYYWSASSYAGSSSIAWNVSFNNGSVSTNDKTNTNYVRCVRSTLPVGPVLADNGNGTVTDFATGLTWQQSDAHNGSDRTHSAAITYCDDLSLAGGGWRLPAIKELSSIVDLRRTGPSVDLNYLPSTKSSLYWSASSYAYDSNNAWLVNFNYGYVAAFNLTNNTFYVRCVR